MCLKLCRFSVLAELVVGAMLGISRSITSAHETMKRGEWAKKKFIGRTLNGKILGIVGFGSVGQEASEPNHAPFACISVRNLVG